MPIVTGAVHILLRVMNTDLGGPTMLSCFFFLSHRRFFWKNTIDDGGFLHLFPSFFRMRHRAV